MALPLLDMQMDTQLAKLGSKHAVPTLRCRLSSSAASMPSRMKESRRGSARDNVMLWLLS